MQNTVSNFSGDTKKFKKETEREGGVEGGVPICKSLLALARKNMWLIKIIIAEQLTLTECLLRARSCLKCFTCFN